MDRLDPAAPREAVDEGPRDGPDARFHGGDGSPAEDRLEQRAVVAVLGRIDLERQLRVVANVRIALQA